MTELGETPQQQAHPEILSSLDIDDIVRLEEIFSSAFSSIQPEDVAKHIPLAIAADSADVLVSRNDEGIIQSAMLVNVDYGAGKLRGRVDDVATHVDSFRQGHAGAVLDLAIDWFRALGVKRVALNSNDDRQAAHRLYQTRGFVMIDTNQFQLDLI